MGNYMRVGGAVLCLAMSVAGCSAEAEEGWRDEGLGAQSEELNVTTDFKLGIQVADFGSAQPGDFAYTATYEGTSSTSTSAWACDGDCFDPDSARLEAVGYTADDVSQKDFRVCIQASDNRTAHSNAGSMSCTPWASQGGGVTGMATDSDGFDPDSFRVQIVTRAWPTNNVDQARDMRFRIRAYDKGGGNIYRVGAWSEYTGWVAQGGGLSGFTPAPIGRDPDGYEIEMEVLETNVNSFCSSAHRCQVGFGDCDSDAECVSGTHCGSNNGADFGYLDSNIDVCVD